MSKRKANYVIKYIIIGFIIMLFMIFCFLIGIFILTFLCVYRTIEDTRRDGAMPEKTEILKGNGTYNKDSGSVTAAEFQTGIFFDPDDIVQVKYEMLRSVARNEMTVSQAADKYGFSRQGFYINKAAFDAGGIAALVPKKTGPKNPHKLTEEGKRFIDAYTEAHPGANARRINVAMAEATGISVHDRTVGRYLSKKRMGSR